MAEYYPYGLKMANISYRASMTMTNRYGWNGGNEYEDEGELNYSNTFYRKYDAQIGRFTGVDIKSEMTVSLNPYHFGYNNPVMFNDPNGDYAPIMGSGYKGSMRDLSDNIMRMYGWGEWAWDTGSGGGSAGGGMGSYVSGSNYGGGQNYFMSSAAYTKSQNANAQSEYFKSLFGQWQKDGYAAKGTYYFSNGKGQYSEEEFLPTVTIYGRNGNDGKVHAYRVDWGGFWGGNWGSGNGSGSGLGGLGNLGTTIWQAGIPPAAPAKDPLLKFVGFRKGFIPEFESRLMNGQGAFTPGPFVIYQTGGSKDAAFNTHEPGHVLQFYLMGPASYYKFIAIPSIFTAATMSVPKHMGMPWEKSASTLWHWFTGESDPSNPHY